MLFMKNDPGLVEFMELVDLEVFPIPTDCFAGIVLWISW